MFKINKEKQYDDMLINSLTVKKYILISTQEFRDGINRL